MTSTPSEVNKKVNRPYVILSPHLHSLFCGNIFSVTPSSSSVSSKQGTVTVGCGSCVTFSEVKGAGWCKYTPEERIHCQNLSLAGAQAGAFSSILRKLR